MLKNVGAKNEPLDAKSALTQPRTSLGKGPKNVCSKAPRWLYFFTRRKDTEKSKSTLSHTDGKYGLESAFGSRLLKKVSRMRSRIAVSSQSLRRCVQRGRRSAWKSCARSSSKWPRHITLCEARSRMYQRRTVRSTSHFAAFFENYKTM